MTQWEEARALASASQKSDLDLQIIGTDIDEGELEMARYHSRQAGVDHLVHFQQKPFADFRSKRKFGVIVTNPPYGERLEDQMNWQPLYESIPAVLQRVSDVVIFSDYEICRSLRRRFRKRRHDGESCLMVELSAPTTSSLGHDRPGPKRRTGQANRIRSINLILLPKGRRLPRSRPYLVASRKRIASKPSCFGTG